mmetsp:Transcript_39935/g.76374  ORF Transcript_39935/g.76374 Transcript_39935/m.76374 type:complete len:1030 (+) Transcript_39935:434-3523(+)
MLAVNTIWPKLDQGVATNPASGIESSSGRGSGSSDAGMEDASHPGSPMTPLAAAIVPTAFPPPPPLDTMHAIEPKPTSIQSRLLDTLWCPSKLKDAARSALKEAPLAAAYGMGFSKGEELRQSATGKGPGHGPMDTSDPAKGSDPTLRNWINQLTPMNGVDAAHGMRLFWQVLSLMTVARDSGVTLRPIRPSHLIMGVVDGEASVVKIDIEEASASSFGPRNTDDAIERQWYTCPGGRDVQNMQSDSYSLGILLFELCFPSKDNHERTHVLQELKQMRMRSDLVRAKPQDAARILWLIQGKPSLHEIRRSDLFRDSKMTLPDAQTVYPKLAHSEVLVDFLGRVHTLESKEHARLTHETAELSQDIEMIKQQLNLARARRRTSQEKRASIERPCGFERELSCKSLNSMGERRSDDTNVSHQAMSRETSPSLWEANVSDRLQTRDSRSSIGGKSGMLAKRSLSVMSLESLDEREAHAELGVSDDDMEPHGIQASVSEHSMRARRLMSHEFHRFEEAFSKIRPSAHGSTRASMHRAPSEEALLFQVEEQALGDVQRPRKSASFRLSRCSFKTDIVGSSNAASAEGDHPNTGALPPRNTRLSEPGHSAFGMGRDTSESNRYGGNAVTTSALLSTTSCDYSRPSLSVPVMDIQHGVDYTAPCQSSIDLLERRERLAEFGNTLSCFSRYSEFEVLATLKNSALPSGVDMVCSSGFDRDDEFFATVGVCKRIKVFEYAKAVLPDVEVHCPVVEMSSRAKLSSVCWSSYIKSHLASSDYQGTVTLWDAANAVPIMEYEEHKKRAWSVDISQKDPNRILSGSDDGTVKLWHTAQEASVATILGKANVCCVQFSPMNSNLVVFGTADYKSYVYDLRSLKAPLKVLSCHKKTVSYVRFLGENKLVSASTDNTLRLWDLNSSDTVPESADGGWANGNNSHITIGPTLTYRGHVNEKNFVGLSISEDGYLACGSEDNKVYSYHQSLPWTMATHSFDERRSGSLERHATSKERVFVSTVCWKRTGNVLLAGNSAGHIKILGLK